MARKARRASQLQLQQLPAPLQKVHLHAAGIDVGADSHFVAVPPDRDKEPVREFGVCTADLYRLADWLLACNVDTVAMESAGVYWIPLYEVLERQGIKVSLVSSKQLRHAPARKSDVSDCQWLQELHTLGLLTGAFRPEDQEVVLRSYLRQRQMLVGYKAKHIQHMQKALTEMNVLVHHAVSDITGATGMRILQAILAGERDPHRLATLRDPSCKNTVATIAKALQGTWREEHLFALRQAVELYEQYQQKIADCDQKILAQVRSFEDRTGTGTGTPPEPPDHKPRKNELTFDAAAETYRITGADLTKIEGIQGHTALLVISEMGRDVSHWPSCKRFTSWLGLCPNNRISGGKRLRQRRTSPHANRIAQALKVAAHTLHHATTALGAFYRRMAARVGKERAIQATAHKLAIRIYHVLKYGSDYVDKGQDYYERAYQERVLKSLNRRAKELGYQLVKEEVPAT
jgi:transposase